jgi:hypothetical protein
VSKDELMSSQEDQAVLIETFKSSLGSDPAMTALMNVTIASITESATRRLGGNLKGRDAKTRVRLQSGIDVKFKVVFDVDQQQFLDVNDGVTKITAQFTAVVSHGNFTDTLQAKAGDGVLASAVGAETATFLPPETKLVALFHPTMQPTISSKPSVLPTTMPSTQKPTLMPTTTVPSFMPTFRTGNL